MTVNGAPAGRRAWIGLAVLALPCVLYSMDLTVLNLAVPALSADLTPTSAQLLWIVDIYGFMLAGSLMTMGTLGDRIGRRKLLLIGAAAFGVGSVLAALSTSPGMLIAARAVLGLAGATLAPSTLSLIRNMFLDSHERSVAIGVWIASYSVGTALGPLVGGLLLEHFWWGSVFLIGVPVMALLLVLGPILLPEFKAPAPGQMDLISAGLSLVGVLLAIYGLKEIAQSGLQAPALISIVAGVTIGALFVRRQRRLADPMIDLRLFRSPAFSVSLAAYTLASFVALGMFIFESQFLQLALGLSPLHAGLWIVPFGVTFILGSLVTPALSRRVRPALMMAGGLTIAAFGFCVLAYSGAPLGVLVPASGLVIYAIGLAPVVTLATDLVVGAAPPARAGSVSALSEMGSELGGALGIAVLGSLGTFIYRGAMTKAALHGVPVEAASTVRDTFAGAVAVAAQLPHPLGPELLSVARDAFTRALRWTAGVSAAIALATGLASAFLLRGVDIDAAAHHDVRPDTDMLDVIPRLIREDT